MNKKKKVKIFGWDELNKETHELFKVEVEKTCLLLLINQQQKL